jgi:hypothetical protein
MAQNVTFFVSDDTAQLAITFQSKSSLLALRPNVRKKMWHKD